MNGSPTTPSAISAGGFIATLGYDSANGLLANLAMSNGLSCAYAYDKMDRLTGLSWKNASNEVLRRQNYSYTLAGLIEGVETEDGGRIAYTYDTLDRLTGEKRMDVYGRVLSHAAYDYDLAGNRTQKTVLDSQSNVLLTVHYTLGTGNRLASWSVAETDLCGLVDVAGHSSAPIRRDDHWGYLWVSNSVSGKVKPEVEGTNFWSYGLRVGLGTQRVYAAIRDLAGNTAYITNAFKLTVVTNASYRYSAAGCLTNIAYRGKDYSQTVGLSWNGEYQLTAVAIDGAIAERYGYDGLGRRVWTWDAANGTNWHVYDGPHVMADLNATGGLLRAYTYGPGIDNVLAMTTYGAATSTVYYVKDRLGSVLALADRNGAILESYRYDTWGRTTAYDASGNTLTQSAYGNRYGWQGREYSFKTGFHYFRARWYDPVTGRWLSNDPIGISGGLNQYVFCANNPVNFGDPMGLCGTGKSGFYYTSMSGLPDGLPYVWSQNLPERWIASVLNIVPLAGNSILALVDWTANQSGDPMMALPAMGFVGGGTKILSSSRLAQKLGVTEEVFHRVIKPSILRDATETAAELGAKNPDIGVTDNGFIVLRNVKTGASKVTDLLIEWFRH